MPGFLWKPKKCYIHYRHRSVSTVRISRKTQNGSMSGYIRKNIAIVKRRYDQYTALGLPVSITDYVMQMNGYLYDNSLSTDPDYSVRAVKLQRELSTYKWHILSDKDMPKTVKVKSIFAVLRAEGILKQILLIKKRLKR